MSFHAKFKKTAFMLVLASAMISLVSGCGRSDPDRDQLVGSWEVIRAGSMNRVLDGRVPKRDDADDSAGIEAIETETPGMVLHFRNSGELQTETRIGGAIRTKQGRWEMDSYDAKAATMTISCELQMQTTQQQVMFIDENTIELTPPNMAGLSTKVKFKRQ